MLLALQYLRARLLELNMKFVVHHHARAAIARASAEIRDLLLVPTGMCVHATGYRALN